VAQLTELAETKRSNDNQHFFLHPLSRLCGSHRGSYQRSHLLGYSGVWVISSSETSICIRTTRRYILEDGNIHPPSWGRLISHMKMSITEMAQDRNFRLQCSPVLSGCPLGLGSHRKQRGAENKLGECSELFISSLHRFFTVWSNERTCQRSLERRFWSENYEDYIMVNTTNMLIQQSFPSPHWRPLF
jgi:hypothetical protein